MTSTARQYHAATLEGATHLGLLLATYDVLAEHIRLAGKAAEAKQIEERCRLSDKANVLIGHLESWVPLLSEPALEASLTSFYTFLRGDLLRLQQTSDKRDFEDLALTICEMRAVWQQKGDIPPTTDRQESALAVVPSRAHFEHTVDERHCWSA